jgi:teichoic acid transport system ATP-binding protein
VGEIVVDGRISALLELGAGFNPEFTGRENVYLNASILGLERKEIDACFKQISDFADIGEFIDQPVKTYSSGMYVRLAFAVAINVNPDILVVDEALSVGDTLFQAKCYAKFQEFQKKGVTILFVTHALDLITRYCNKAYLLDHGHLHASGSAKEVADEYNRMQFKASCKIANNSSLAKGSDLTATIGVDQGQEWRGLFLVNPKENRYGNGLAKIVGAGIFSLDDKPVQSLWKGQDYDFRMKVMFNAKIEDPVFAYTIKDIKGFDISGTNTMFQKIDTGKFKANDQVLVSFRQNMILSAGSYLISFGCAGYENGEYVIYERRYDYMVFEVLSDRANVGFLDLESKITMQRL